MNLPTQVSDLCRRIAQLDWTKPLQLEQLIQLQAQLHILQDRCNHDGVPRQGVWDAISEQCPDCQKPAPAFPFLYPVVKSRPGEHV